MSANYNSRLGSRMPSAAEEEEGEGIFKKDNMMSGDAPAKDDYWQFNYTLSPLPPPPQQELVSMPPPVMDVNHIQECSTSTAKDDYWLQPPQYNNYMLPPPLQFNYTLSPLPPPPQEELVSMPPPVMDVNPTQEYCSSSTTANRFRPTDEEIIDYQFQQEQYGGHGFNGINPFIAAPQQQNYIYTYDYQPGHDQLNSTGEYQICFRSMVSDTTAVLPNIPDDYPAAEQDLVMDYVVSMPPAEEEGILVINNDNDVVVPPPAIGVVLPNDAHEDVNRVANVQEQVLMGDYNRPNNSYRFRPMDSELIKDLRGEYNGVAGDKSIIHLDIYAYEPHQLRAFSEDHGDGKMYFFTRITKCGKNYTDRSIKSRRGCNWKVTQAPKPIIDGISKKIIGYKRPLKYCVEKKNTSWSMIEYTLAAADSSHHSMKEELVVAVIYELHRNRR